MMGLGLQGFGLSRVDGMGLNLDAFMAAQSDGLYFDFTRTATTFQDTSATTPADDAGEAIGRVNDVRVGTGSPHNATQGTANLCPLRDANGAKFDGSNDYLATSYVGGAAGNFIVAYVVAPASIAASQIVTGGANGSGVRFFLSMNVSGNAAAGIDSQGSTVIHGSIDHRSQTFVYGVSINGATVRLFDDAAGLVYEAPQTGPIDTSIALYVGCQNAAATPANFFAGTIRKIAFGREFLTPARFRQIRQAMMQSSFP